MKAGRVIRVGIIGAGFAGRLHAEAYKRCPGVELVAIADKDKNASNALRAQYDIQHVYTDYNELLKREDIDLVSVCVPTFLHKDVVIAAAHHGKHVVCEKPLAVTVADAECMISVAQAERIRLMYAENWIFAPALRRAVAICREGAIGEVLFIRAKEAHSGSHSIYAKKLCYCGGGAMMHLGIHPIGFGLSFFEGEVLRVWCVTSRGSEQNVLHHDVEGEDWGIGVIEFPGPRICQVEANYLTHGGIDDVVEFYGTEGVIKVNFSHGSPLRVFSRVGVQYTVEKADVKTGWSFPAVDEFRSLGYEDEIAHFVSCVRGEAELEKGMRAEDGLRALVVLQKMYESAQKGTIIER